MIRKTFVLAASPGCAGEQQWAHKPQPKTEQEQRLIGRLTSDPHLRAACLNKIAGPASNKSFESGMIP